MLAMEYKSAPLHTAPFPLFCRIHSGLAFRPCRAGYVYMLRWPNKTRDGEAYWKIGHCYAGNIRTRTQPWRRLGWIVATAIEARCAKFTEAWFHANLILWRHVPARARIKVPQSSGTPGVTEIFRIPDSAVLSAIRRVSRIRHEIGR